MWQIGKLLCRRIGFFSAMVLLSPIHLCDYPSPSPPPHYTRYEENWQRYRPRNSSVINIALHLHITSWVRVPLLPHAVHVKRKRTYIHCKTSTELGKTSMNIGITKNLLLYVVSLHYQANWEVLYWLPKGPFQRTIQRLYNVFGSPQIYVFTTSYTNVIVTKSQRCNNVATT